MKILITSDWYAPVINGVVTSVLLLKKELEKLGHEVRVVTLSSTRHSYREGDVYYVGSVNASFVYPGARLKINRTRSLARELVEWGPEVVHSQCEFSTFHLACVISDRLGIPMVHTYHTVYEDYTHYFSPSVRLGKQVVTVFSRWVGRRTACIVAPSPKVERLLRAYGIKCRVEVIPTGVDLDIFDPAPDQAELQRLREHWRIPEDKTVLLYLGRMAREKGLEELIDYIADAGRDDCVLLLVGSGPNCQEVLDHAQERGLPVIYTGMVPHDQVPLYYRLGDIFVTASTSETQGLTYFEALAAGLPVLCKKDPCVEGVVEDGVNGWQYETSADFGRYLGQFCLHPAQRDAMSGAALDSAQRFSGAAFGRAAQELYQSLIQAKEEEQKEDLG
jgi:1,2-diacylglycerol 3-alpha-glucosyltransferase